MFARTGLTFMAACAVLSCAPAPQRPDSVVLVVVDTTRADRMGFHGGERDITPELDRWAEGGAVFDIALAPSPWTLPSLASILTGVEPGTHRAGERIAKGSRPESFGALASDIPTLAETLQGAGMRTAAVVNNPYLSPSFGLDRGFDSYDYDEGKRGIRRSAAVVVDTALAWIDENDDAPFFLFVHLMDPHLPYDPDPSVLGRFTGSIDPGNELPIRDLKQLREEAPTMPAARRSFISAAYDEELHYVDREVARFFEALESSRGDRPPVAEHAVILLTSDHGEELFDHGSLEHGHTLYQELLHVPLAVRAPGAPPGRVREPVALSDLAPTLLEALEIEPPPALAGYSLWPVISGRGEVAARTLVATWNLYGTPHRAMMRWPHKLIVNQETGAAALYNLESDPGETLDLSGDLPELTRLMSAELEARVIEPVGEGQAAELPLEVQEELRELGYVE